jgi:hypothetical protein
MSLSRIPSSDLTMNRWQAFSEPAGESESRCAKRKAEDEIGHVEPKKPKSVEEQEVQNGDGIPTAFTSETELLDQRILGIACFMETASESSLERIVAAAAEDAREPFEIADEDFMEEELLDDETDQKDPWSRSELKVLMSAVRNHKKGDRIDWEQVSRVVATKTAQQCQSRYQYNLNRERKGGVKDLIRYSQHEKGSILFFSKRSKVKAAERGIQCRNLEYIINKLKKYNLELDKSKSQLENYLFRLENLEKSERRNLVDIFLQENPHLKEKNLSLKNVETPQEVSGIWTKDEVDCLQRGLDHYYGKTPDWAKIAKEVGTKTPAQCKKKYFQMKNVKKPSERKKGGKKSRYTESQLGSVFFFERIAKNFCRDRFFVLDKIKKYHGLDITKRQLGDIYTRYVKKTSEDKKNEFQDLFLKDLKEKVTSEKYDKLLTKIKNKEDSPIASPPQEYSSEWTEDEAKLLEEALQLQSSNRAINWSMVSDKVKTKLPKQCQTKHRTLLRKIKNQGRKSLVRKFSELEKGCALFYQDLSITKRKSMNYVKRKFNCYFEIKKIQLKSLLYRLKKCSSEERQSYLEAFKTRKPSLKKPVETQPSENDAIELTSEQMDLFLNICKAAALNWAEVSSSFFKETQVQISPDRCKQMYQMVQNSSFLSEEPESVVDLTLEQRDLFLNICKCAELNWETVSSSFFEAAQIQLRPADCETVYQALDQNTFSLVESGS